MFKRSCMAASSMAAHGMSGRWLLDAHGLVTVLCRCQHIGQSPLMFAGIVGGSPSPMLAPWARLRFGAMAAGPQAFRLPQAFGCHCVAVAGRHVGVGAAL